MRKLVLSIVMASAAISAAPASAQMWRLQPQVRNEIRQDINQLDNRIDRAAARHTISRREALGLRRDADNLRRTYWRYNRNGLDRREVRDLQDRINIIYERLRMERRDWDNRRG